MRTPINGSALSVALLVLTIAGCSNGRVHPVDAGTRGDAELSFDASPSSDAGTGPDAGTGADGGVAPASARRMLMVLADHNGLTSFSESEALAMMDESDTYYRRSSCDAVHFAGIEAPAQATDVLRVDLPELRPFCDIDADCARGGCAVGRCECEGDVFSAALVAARDEIGDRFDEYDSVGVVYDASQPWLACLPAYPCHSPGGSRVWTCDVSQVQTHAHEIGHSLGFGHANTLTDPACHERGDFGCASDEYGDIEDVMGSDIFRRYTLGLAHLMGADWLAGRVERTTGGTYCVHPFDPPRTDRATFCDDRATLRAVELDLADDPFDDQVQVGLRGELDEIKIYISSPGGTMGATVLVTSLGTDGDSFEAAPVVLPELSDPLRPGYVVRRGARCEGDGVEIEVGVVGG